MVAGERPAELGHAVMRFGVSRKSVNEGSCPLHAEGQRDGPIFLRIPQNGVCGVITRNGAPRWG